MSLQVICLEDVAQQRWRNGGGYTRELLAWPAVERWDLRISVADIEVAGPFSAFEGVERWIAVISGVGIALNFGDGECQLAPGDEPLRFDGAAAPDCRLLGGQTRDLNLMVRRGEGTMRPVSAGLAWNEPFAIRGIFTTAAGRWASGGNSHSVPAMTLLWSDTTATLDSAWTFQPDTKSQHPCAWWLGYTPQTHRP